jgi:hypothetical protein
MCNLLSYLMLQAKTMNINCVMIHGVYNSVSETIPIALRVRIQVKNGEKRIKDNVHSAPRGPHSSRSWGSSGA